MELISKEEFVALIPAYVLNRDLIELLDRMSWPIPASTVDTSAEVE